MEYLANTRSVERLNLVSTEPGAGQSNGPYLWQILSAPGKTTQPERNLMYFKFSIGQAVEYTPIGEKKAGLYTISRQMPTEDQATDLKYRIKNENEPYERNVPESQLSADVGSESEYSTIKRRLLNGSRAT
jgi:hypothetical protein